MKSITRRYFSGGIALLPALRFAPAIAQTNVSPAEARAIAKDAYIYGFPVVDNYRVPYAYFVDTKSREYKAPWNQIWNSSRLFTAADKAIQTANSDTLYSMVGADLRAEPLVLTVPAMEKDRYFSVQLIDYYTQNFDYIGTRTTGNGGGTFLLAGPNWKGETPKGINKVFRSETELAFPGYRTQLFNPADLDNVKKVQAGYKVQTLSAFLKQPAPPPAPAIDFPKIDKDLVKTNFFEYLDFALQFAPPQENEKEIRAALAKIGVGPGKTFNFKDLPIEQKLEVGLGMKEGDKKVD